MCVWVFAGVRDAGPGSRPQHRVLHPLHRRHGAPGGHQDGALPGGLPPGPVHVPPAPPTPPRLHPRAALRPGAERRPLQLPGRPLQRPGQARLQTQRHPHGRQPVSGEGRGPFALVRLPGHVEGQQPQEQREHGWERGVLLAPPPGRQLTCSSNNILLLHMFPSAAHSPSAAGLALLFVSFGVLVFLLSSSRPCLHALNLFFHFVRVCFVLLHLCLFSPWFQRLIFKVCLLLINTLMTMRYKSRRFCI